MTTAAPRRLTKTGLIATFVRVKDRAALADDTIVSITDSSGALICWCGPYTRDIALRCRELFETGIADANLHHASGGSGVRYRAAA